MSTATIVSCFYDMPTNKKHTIDSYIQWISIFLQYCDTPIVMFSDGEVATYMDTYRKSISPRHAANWKLIRRPLHALAFHWPEFWKETIESDTRRTTYTADICMIWANKSQFLEEVANSNPFQSSHFYWCDAGCWRNRAFAERYAPNWPSKLDDPIQLTWVENLDRFQNIYRSLSPCTIDSIFTIETQKCVTLGGAIFGGSKESVLLYSDCIRKSYELYRTKKLFAADDQAVMASAAFLMQHLYGDHTVKHCSSSDYPILGDRWFLFQYLLT